MWAAGGGDAGAELTAADITRAAGRLGPRHRSRGKPTAKLMVFAIGFRQICLDLFDYLGIIT